MLPHFGDMRLTDMLFMSYAERAAHIVWPFAACDLWTFEEFVRLIEDAYGSQWRDPAITPLRELEKDLHVLELFHGPTLAFKDCALQGLGRLVSHGLNRRGKKIAMLTATSGDTGSATMAAFANLDNVDAFVMFPKGRVSEFQRRQMTTMTAPNVHAIEILGTFDDCQDIAKALQLPSANSINFFRPALQIAYYFEAVLQVMKRTGAARVNVAVPSGNFGNMYAAICAKLEGLPIDLLIAGTNKNRMVANFIRHGVFESGVVEGTWSPSMDIQVASNLERLAFDLVGRDSALIRMHYAGTSFIVDRERMRSLGLRADWTDEEGCLRTIRAINREYGYVIDPHTAHAMSAALRLRGENTSPTVVLATAAPVKFGEAMKEALGVAPALPAEFADIYERTERVETLDKDSESVREYINKKLHELNRGFSV